jgi:nucleoside-diphosphate-sugar epimerase
VKECGSYNLSGISFSSEEIAAEVVKYIPGFKMSYAPDERQAYADSWPRSIDDSAARRDWGWKPEFDLKAMSDDMMKHLKATLAPK